jgi:hypothetical protein
MAELRSTSVKDLVFANTQLLQMIGKTLPAKPDLLLELSELLDLSPRQMTLQLLPHALPEVKGGLVGRVCVCVFWVGWGGGDEAGFQDSYVPCAQPPMCNDAWASGRPPTHVH